jgi:tripartite-type tricarboxylate transporter receptor subunit TctC
MNTKTGPARRAILAGVAAAPFLASATRAQAWPVRSITLVVPFAPGGGTDTFARPFAAKLSQELGQQVVVDNRAGAGGTVGAALVAKAKPDGYTLLLGSVHHAVAVSAYKQLSYDLEKDLAPITSVASVPDVLVVYPGIPANTLQQFIAYCKANPGKVNFGSAGLGTTRHLAGEIFNGKTGAGMTHVPYKGSGPATAALISGEVTAVFEGLGSAAPYIRSGKARALAVFTAERSPAFPDIPTAAQAGLPGFESLSWYGLWAPAGTDPAIVARMQAAVAAAFASPDLKKVWDDQGAAPGGAPTARFAAFVKEEIGKWGKVVRDGNITIE